MSATPTHPATLDAALRRRATTLVWYLDLDLYDAEADTTETRHYATLETTLRPADSQAPGRRYAGRLLPPELSWSLVRGQQVEGASTADSARLEWLDLGGRDADIAARQLSAQGQSATLWLGHPELDSALWRPFRFTGRRLQEVATGWALDLRTLDFPLDQPLPRRRLLGLGGCVALDGAHHLSIEPAADLSPGISPGISPGAPLAVEALVRTSAGGQQVAASKGPIPSCDWALWIPGDGAPRWWLRDAAGGVRVVAGPEPVNDGQLHRLAGWWDGAVLRLLVDGVEVGSTVFDGAPQSSPTVGITLGDDGTGSRRLVGDLDDVRVWLPPYGPTAAAPTLDELRAWALRELPAEHHRRPRVYLRMNEGFGPVAYDDSLHEHGAAIVGPTPEALWSTLGEGSPEQRDQPRPLGLGRRGRVPGLAVGPRVWQVSDAGCHGLGPVDEGGNKLRPRRSWTADDITIDTGPGGLSPSLPVDWLRTAGAVDFGGLVRAQYLRITTPTQAALLRVMADSTPEEITLEGGVLVAEGPGVEMTIETAGYEATAADMTIDAAAGTLTSAGALRLIGQRAGDRFVLDSPANAGTYTLAEDAKAQQLRVVEGFATGEGPGVAMSITFEDPHEYTVDLAMGTAHLKAEPTLPLAFAFRGPLAAGSTRASLMRWLAEHGGHDPAEMDPVLIDTVAWDAFAEADPGTVGLWLAHDDVPTTREAMDRLSHGASWGTNLLTGRLDVALRSLDAEPALELHYPRDFLELAPHSTVPPIAGQVVQYAQNGVPLDEDQIAGRVRDTEPATLPTLRAEFQTVEAMVDPVLARRHPLATPAEPLPAAYEHEGDALRGAQHLYDLDAPGRQVWRAVLPLGVLLLLDWRRQLVRITSSHHAGLVGGRKLLTLSLTLRDAQHAVDVLFWG